MGLINVELMVPFVRTSTKPQVIALLASNGLNAARTGCA